MSNRPERYDPKVYWARLHEEDSLRSVGQAGLPIELNAWLYRILERNLRDFLRRHRVLEHPVRRVFEVGAGTGYWTPFWYELGALRVDGCDLAEAAVARLRARFPDSTFDVGDIAEPGVIPSDRSYDLVTVFNVLLHITDEDRFEAAARHVGGAVAPGGYALLVEPAWFRADSERPAKPGASSIARPLARYREAIEVDGLEFVAGEGSTAVANNPIEHGSPHIERYRRMWRWAVRESKRGPRRASAVGRVLSVVDRPLMRMRSAPSGKILLFRRPA